MEKYKYEDLEQYDGFDTDEMEALQKKYAYLIGKFLLHFSLLEYSLNIELANIINERSHDEGYLIIKGLTYNEKVDLFRDLSRPRIYWIEKKKKYKLERLNFILQGLKRSGELRNKIAHANWYTLDNDGYVRVGIRSDNDSGMIKFQKQKLTPEIIKKGIRELSKIDRKLQDFWEQLY